MFVCVREHADAETVHLLLGAVNQLVLIGALIAGTHPFILPESLGMLIEFLEVSKERECLDTGAAPSQ